MNKLFIDLTGLFKLLNKIDFLRYVFLIFLNIPSILKDRNLSIVDLKYGSSVQIKYYNKVYHFSGNCVIGSIREIWIRNIYSKNNFLKIDKKNPIIFDLGANVGMFSSFALALNKNSCRIFAFEPGNTLNKYFKNNIDLNFPNADVNLISAFVGGISDKQIKMKENQQYQSSTTLSLDQFIINNDIKEIDFLKCDIEGGEFGLFEISNKLFEITSKIAIEVHDFAGERSKIFDFLSVYGFNVFDVTNNPNDCIVLAHKN